MRGISPMSVQSLGTAWQGCARQWDDGASQPHASHAACQPRQKGEKPVQDTGTLPASRGHAAGELKSAPTGYGGTLPAPSACASREALYVPRASGGAICNTQHPFPLGISKPGKLQGAGDSAPAESGSVTKPPDVWAWARDDLGVCDPREQLATGGTKVAQTPALPKTPVLKTGQSSQLGGLPVPPAPSWDMAFTLPGLRASRRGEPHGATAGGVCTPTPEPPPPSSAVGWREALAHRFLPASNPSSSAGSHETPFLGMTRGGARRGGGICSCANWHYPGHQVHPPR